jgi:hypothetical protein
LRSNQQQNSLRPITEAEIFCGIQLLTKGKRREGLLAAAEAYPALNVTTEAGDCIMAM